MSLWKEKEGGSIDAICTTISRNPRGPRKFSLASTLLIAALPLGSSVVPRSQSLPLSRADDVPRRRREAGIRDHGWRGFHGWEINGLPYPCYPRHPWYFSLSTVLPLSRADEVHRRRRERGLLATNGADFADGEIIGSAYSLQRFNASTTLVAAWPL